jgi:ribA/ribD-fused uncharacterized protein
MSKYWERETEDSIFFWGGIFSQWYPSVFKDELGVEFSSTEQFMMYHKCLTCNDHVAANNVMAEHNPRLQKAIGRSIKPHLYNEEAWSAVRYKVVVEGNLLKFTQDKTLKELLLSTGDKEIVEASHEDPIWGIGLAPHDDRVLDKNLWKGTNLLGKAIMDVREKIKKEMEIQPGMVESK